MEWCQFARSIFPTVSFRPDIPCCISPARLRSEKTHYVNYDIPRCSIKGCENANKGYMIIFNHMQRFYHLMCQSNWCQNASKLIMKRITFRFYEILKTWSIVSLISMYDAELADDRNQMNLKINPRQTFFQSTRCSILPPCFILPRLTIYDITHYTRMTNNNSFKELRFFLLSILWWKLAMFKTYGKSCGKKKLEKLLLLTCHHLFAANSPRTINIFRFETLAV